MCIYTMMMMPFNCSCRTIKRHLYARYTVVSDLEGSDNGDPLYGIIYCRLSVIHGLVTVSTISTPGPRECVCAAPKITKAK
jgi:hypothetical protein